MKRAADICRGRHGRNPESELANERVAPSKSYQRATLLAFFVYRGSTGGTCEEASRETGIRYTTCSARISELKAERWLVPVETDGKPVRRKTSTGSSAAVLRAQSAAERRRDPLVVGFPVQRSLFEARA